MLKIWGRNNSINVQKVLWAVDELGLKFEREDAGGAFGKTDTPEYLAMNPNSLVPTVRDGNNVMWESNSILRYLGATYGAGSLWPTDPGARTLADRWMDWQLSTISESMRICFWGLVRTPPEKRDMAAIGAAAKQAGVLFGRLDGWLAGKRFVAGDSFTIGDIPVGCFAYRWNALPIERPNLPNLQAWYGRLRERAPYMKHVAVPMT